MQKIKSRMPPTARPAVATVLSLLRWLAVEVVIGADEGPDDVATDVESEVDVVVIKLDALVAVVFAVFNFKAAPAVKILAVSLQQSKFHLVSRARVPSYAQQYVVSEHAVTM
ncbi:hypothetical protein B0A48_02506 [Cryoendolithus antarcticus]|uniref:Uncharacterized protein n=1 Tax=Cryoendolithus antarcticus TaxID=1507870 RepID=A0A1V8TPA4_9PEZI|nr:hypothetical protein B0A48_02506 [Cryoendolithus antarcticus]